jgi:3-oxoacid CoA-transferase subunit A
VPKGVFVPEKMQAVYWDYIRADIYSNEMVRNDTNRNAIKENIKLQKEIFTLHKITKEEFYKSYDYYLNHPALMQEMLDTMTVRQQKKIDIIKEKKAQADSAALKLLDKKCTNLFPMTKKYENAKEAVADIHDGATLMLGGFGLCGIPENCIAALVEKGVNMLTCISNNAGVDDFGIGLMLQKRQVKKMIASYVGENAEFERQLLNGELEVDLIPQGTLATRCMAAGYGMPAIFTPAGVGTEIAVGKEIRNFNGKDYLLELAFDADFALVKAWKGDTEGNLIFKDTARNFNPLMAMAGRITIAEVEELVPAGTLDPNHIHTPGIYVHRIFQGSNYEKRIEQRTVRK